MVFGGFWKKFVKTQYEFLYTEDIKENQDLINSLRDAINKDSPLPVVEEPKKLGELNVYQLSALLKPHCKNINLSDKNYSLTSVEEAKNFSKQTQLFAKKYVTEAFDCDEFSSALNGYWNVGLKQFAFGIAWSKAHAFNICIDDNKQIWIVEPQSNKFTKIEHMKNVKKYYPLTLVLI